MNKKRVLAIVANIIAIGLLIAFIVAANGLFAASTNKEITYDEFLRMVDQGKVESVKIGPKTIDITAVDDKTTYHTGYLQYEELVSKLHGAGVVFSSKTEGNSVGNILFTLLINFGPLLIIVFLFSKAFSQKDGGGIFSVGKSKAKLNIDSNINVKFEDVAGQAEAKEQLVEIIDYLHNPEKYKKIGAKIPKGALLVGPPGTGKTLLAKAVAGEAGVPFFSETGSNFVEMFVGVGASRIRDLFAQAKKHAPCIIFIDEVDSIASKRDSGIKGNSNDEREQTLNQLLAEMDGFDSSLGIIILAATNRPESLDQAFLRAGRFDRKIIVERPDFKGRVETLKVHSKNVCLADDVDFDAIAYATTGSVGADIENIVNEAALHAVKFNREKVTQEDFMEAVETVFAGKEKKDRIMSDREKKLVAYHEVGHAVVAALQKNSSPVQKITIVPRTKGSLGYTLQIPEEEKYLSSKEDMLSEIKILCGGRCAEEIFFDTKTSGAANDIERATNIARQMVTLLGMSDKFDLMVLENVEGQYINSYTTRQCSDETSTLVDKEILTILKACHNDALETIKSNKKAIEEIASFLLDKETITGEEFMDIFRQYHPEIKEAKQPVSHDSDSSIKKSERHIEIKKEEKAEPEIIKEFMSDDQEQEPQEKSPSLEAEAPKKSDIEEPKDEDLTPINVNGERPSASVLTPKKKKKKKKVKVSEEDMANLLGSISTPSSKPLYEKAEEAEKEPTKNSGNESSDTKPQTPTDIPKTFGDFSEDDY